MADDAERWIQQMRKGSSKLAILQLLRESDRYGYELIALARERTDGALAIAEGNLYPALHALEAEGHLESYWREVESQAPARKYYRLTPSGGRLCARFVDEWRAHARAVERLLEGDGDHEDRRRREGVAGADDRARAGTPRGPRGAV